MRQSENDLGESWRWQRDMGRRRPAREPRAGRERAAAGIPALTIIEMTDLDLDHLDMAADGPHYHLVLGAIVDRIQKGKQHDGRAR
jgi:hypothetical protein